MEVGFMQGRLSPPVNGAIQAFPAKHWRHEFVLAEQNGFGIMEWTLDHDGLDENPLLGSEGRAEILELCSQHDVRVPSLTADFFMQAPFHKLAGAAREAALLDLRRVIVACSNVGIRQIVIPLVDNGRIEGPAQHEDVRGTLAGLAPLLEQEDVALIFESDFPPASLQAFIQEFPARWFGINYDTGNSAALGYDPAEEIAAYGSYIRNVHIKDRQRGGSTVPLGAGAADLPRTFALLAEAGYAGNFILQTARAADGDDVGALVRYRDLVVSLLQQPLHAA